MREMEQDLLHLFYFFVIYWIKVGYSLVAVFSISKK